MAPLRRDLWKVAIFVGSGSADVADVLPASTFFARVLVLARQIFGGLATRLITNNNRLP